MADADIGKLVLALGSPDAAVRLEASVALEDITRWEGEGTGAAIRAMANALISDENPNVRTNVVWAFHHAAMSFGHPDLSPAVPALAKALSDKEDGIPESAVWTLLFLARSLDISPAVPALAETVFHSSNYDAIERAAEALISAARRGSDIAVAIPALESAVHRKIISRKDAEGVLESDDAHRKKRDAAMASLAGQFPPVGDRPKWDVFGGLEDAAGRSEDMSAAMPALAGLLSDDEQHFRERAAGVLEAAALNDKNRDASLSALAGELSNPNPLVCCLAVRTLGSAASKKADITSAVPALVKALSGGNQEVRLYSAEALGLAGREGTDITSAVMPLLKAIFDEVDDVATNANWALSSAFNNEKNRVAASSLLVTALSHEDAGMCRASAVVLGLAIGKCGTPQELDAVGRMLTEKCAGMKDQEGGAAGTDSVFPKLHGEIAKRRNALASGRDVMLDDIPRPPKPGSAYQRVRAPSKTPV